MRLKVVITVLCLILCCESSNDNDSDDNEDNHVVDIATKQKLESLMEEHSSFVLEVYSPECPHCVTFMPQYKKLSQIFKDTVLFARINALEANDFYETFFQVRGLPSVFLYDKGTFYNYEGINSVDFLYEWIEKKNGFTCKRITSSVDLVSLIDDNILNDHGYRKPFILGVFDKSSQSSSLKNFFIGLTEINRQYVTECKYYLFDFDTPSESNAFLLRHNFIYSYHYQKGINTFALLDQINWDKELRAAKIEIGREYERFLIDNWFGLIEEYDDFKLNVFGHWEGSFLVFSYETTEERAEYEVIAKKFIASKYFDRTVLIVFVNLQRKYAVKYYRFLKEKGVFYSKAQFKKMKAIELTNQSKLPYEVIFNKTDVKPKKDLKKAPNDIHRFIKANIIDKINKEEMKFLNGSVNEPAITNTTSQTEAQGNDSNNSDKFLQGEEHKEMKMQDGLRIEDDSQNIHFNTKIILLPFYLLVYSALFFCVYKRYAVYAPSRAEQIKNI